MSLFYKSTAHKTRKDESCDSNIILVMSSTTSSYPHFFDTLFLQLLPTLSITGEVRHATLNSHNRSWGPARHTELAESQLRSGTQHWTHEITVGVRHATLNSQDRGWGPARHTALTGSRLGSSTPHWTHRIAVEVRHATLNSQNRDRTRRRRRRRRRQEAEEEEKRLT